MVSHKATIRAQRERTCHSVQPLTRDNHARRFHAEIGGDGNIHRFSCAFGREVASFFPRFAQAFALCLHKIGIATIMMQKALALM